jgi:hypothetical protein
MIPYDIKQRTVSNARMRGEKWVKFIARMTFANIMQRAEFTKIMADVKNKRYLWRGKCKMNTKLLIIIANV